jgi:hypothetical protein
VGVMSWLPFVILLLVAVIMEMPSMLRWLTDRYR